MSDNTKLIIDRVRQLADNFDREGSGDIWALLDSAADEMERLYKLMGGGSMSAREDYAKLHANTSGPSHRGQTSREAQAALDEIDVLRVENERLGARVDRQESMPPMVVVCAERGEHRWPDDDPYPLGYGDIIAFKCSTCGQWVTT